MRSGVIAQKLGMTRVFTDAGEQVPVTVLKLDNCQVVAQRTDEKNGYTALQLGVGLRKVKNTPQALRGHFAKASVEPKRKVAEFRVSPENLIDVGAELTADHFVAGQFVDVTGTSHRQGLPGRHEAPELRRRPRHPRHLGLAPFARFDRPAPGPRQGVQGQEDGRPHGRRARHHAEPQDRPAPTSTRGLIMVEGAVPGAKGGWILVRDAVKRRAAGRACRCRARSGSANGCRPLPAPAEAAESKEAE